ncbi:centrosomal protein 15 isoform X4 [Narcine bancroftii]|uniref:centrosomal protein 15 isoform X4 n=1 Tax=Narcine bancroftii TaxID=1343680 RepID=UPI003831E171
MKMSYLAQELELGKRHEKILGLRTTLLQQMKGQCESQTNEKKLQVLKFESANERNALLLKTMYWTSTEEQLPKWEQYFLGQTRNLFEGRNPRHKKSQNELLPEKNTTKNTNLLSPESTNKKPPQFPHSRKQVENC